MTLPPGDRPAVDPNLVPDNPCVVCWRTRRLLTRAVYVAENPRRRIVLCERHKDEFAELDQADVSVVTTYRHIRIGERVVIAGMTYGNGLD